ncbi:MAG TPA: DUF86 domain-containing protein [Candidatus Nanoarchaeia archaeon]|nr:DUF86 domain-containing protein [Candidatus Nanoarchaeia archaeon]
MNARIKDKIQEIEQYVDELDEIIPDVFSEYAGDKKTKAACERYFEKIVEAVVDLAFLIIKEDGLKSPEDDKGVFEVLAKAEKIPGVLAAKLKDAKGMRNVIAHEYGSIDDELVFESMQKELAKDVRAFIKSVKSN